MRIKNPKLFQTYPTGPSSEIAKATHLLERKPRIVNAAILILSTLIAASPVEPTGQWKDKIADESVMKLAPMQGFITDASAFEKLWKAWRPKEEVPVVDFKKEIIIVGVAQGPNLVYIKPSLDDRGDLHYEVTFTEKFGPGFGYLLIKVYREGVKTVNGKPLS